MADDPDPDRLRALEARLERVRDLGKPKQRSETGKGFSQGEIAWRMVIELVTGMIVGMGIGYGIDLLAGTLPVFLAIFTLLGFAAGVKTMLGTAAQMNKTVPEQSRAGEKEDGRGDGK